MNKKQLIVCLHNIRSTYNVGAILRTCEGFGVSKAVFSGYTPRVHDKGLLPHLRDKLDHQIGKTALGAEDLVKCSATSNLTDTIAKYRKQGWQIVGLENNLKDERLCLLNDPDLKSKLGDKLFLLLGEEVEGIPQELYDQIDLFLEIPMQGQKESFNVSVATGVALYALSTL